MALIAFTFSYMMFGGANSLVYTNLMQTLMKLIVAVILLGSGYMYFTNGFAGFLDRLSAVDPALALPFNAESPLFRDFFEVVICQFIVGVAVVCQPHIITESLLLKRDSAVNRYLFVGIAVQIIFFSVVFTGLYARLTFPDLTRNGQPIKLDAVMSVYAATKFSAVTGLLLMLGLLSSGLSTLEGLIQSLSITITTDLLKPMLGGKLPMPDIMMNRLIIAGLAVVSFFVSYDQLLHPDLSVGIFAQNAVYAYFAAMFIPVLFGTFLKNVSAVVPLAAALTGLSVHFSVYYGRLTPYLAEGTRNPGIAATLAILSALLVGSVLQISLKSTPKTPVADETNALAS